MSRAALAAALGAAVLAGCGGEGVKTSGGRGLTVAQQTPNAPPARARPLARARRIPGTGAITAYVKRAKVLRSRPGGRVLALLKRRTEFGSPRVLTVVGRRGRWLAVLAAEVGNGRVGWIDGRRDVELFRTPWTVTVDVSSRMLTVRDAGRVVTRTAVAVGRPAAPTPRGRFAVTDKLTTGNDVGPYGCCVLALTAHQPNIPQGWGGGDRVAIHATPSPQTIGQATSTGCLRTTNQVMRRLVRGVPLGTPVRIQA
jgi:hypothetical protein